MKLSKSKLALAKVINESGGWFGDAENAAQDSDGDVDFYSGTPSRVTGREWWSADGLIAGSRIRHDDAAIKNWHQTILSREEYYHAYPKTDADEWIEVTQSGCPVDEDDVIQVRFRDDDGSGMTPDVASNYIWDFDGSDIDVVSYRLHKQGDKYDTGDGEQNPVIKPEFCESVMCSIPEPESIDELCAKVTEENKHQHTEAKPTIEQLAQDYRNKLYFANRKQQEADEAKAAADAALGELERAGEALGLLIGIANPGREPELAITDWRDLKVGDEISVFDFEDPSYNPDRKIALSDGLCVVTSIDGGVYIAPITIADVHLKYWNATGIDACKFKFIRRP